MDIRPTIRVGDVVKLSKKGREFPREFPIKSTMVVSNVYGDGIDYYSVITCRISYGNELVYHKFYRSELWTTGINVFNK